MATPTGCDIWLGDAATNMVSTAYDKYTEFATKAYGLATQQVSDLGNFRIAPIAFGVSYNLDSAITGYKRPAAPATPGDLTYHAPAAVPDAPSVTLAPLTFDTPPAAPADAPPTIREYADPGELAATAPSGVVALQDVPIPARPDYELPPAPTLAELKLPDAPTLNLPAFTGTRPDTALDAPLETFSFTAEQYNSMLLSKTSTQISFMLDGGTGLPAAIAQALRDRAFAALDGQEYRAVQQATEEFASRGFAQPNGILARTLAEVRQNNQNQRNAASRDIAIQDQQVAVENLRFAVQQGVALESALFQAHNEEMRIGLAVAQAAQDVRIRVFEARVSLVNLSLQAYQVDAQVWREQLQGELAKLEVYRSELQALQVRGELNVQQVQLYTEKLRGITMLTDLYRADIEAAKLVMGTNQQQIDIERSKIAMYGEQVGAYRTVWDAYRTKLETNSIRANVYQLVEQGYATRLRGWSDVQQQKIAVQTLAINEADLRQRGWRGQLDRVIAEMQAETSRLNAVEGVYRSNVAAYAASAQVETAASDANLRALQLASDRERNRTDVALKNAEIAINQLVEISRLMVAVKQGIATVSSQLAASSMSAVNFSAGVHSSRGQSQSCGTNFSYSGSLDSPAP